MATVLEECITEEQSPGVRFLWAKGLNSKDIYKGFFLFVVERNFRVKLFQPGGKRFADEEVETEVRKCLRQQ
jgi:hypothetical protein